MTCQHPKERADRTSEQTRFPDCTHPARRALHLHLFIPPSRKVVRYLLCLRTMQHQALGILRVARHALGSQGVPQAGANFLHMQTTSRISATDCGL